MTTIKLKSGSGAPLASDLVAGEPALDLTNKRLYTENASGTVIEVGTNPSTLTVDTTTLVVDAANNKVGVGTASPPSKFSVVGGETYVWNGVGAGVLETKTSGNDAIINAKGTASAELVFQTGAGTERMRIDSSGNVGIGTSSPAYPLQVNGKSYALQNVNANGSAAAPSYAFGNDEDCGMYRAAVNTVGFSTAGTEAMRIDSSGNVNIGGTTSSSSRLKLIGDGGTYTNYHMLLEGGLDDDGEHAISLMSTGDALGGVIGSNFELNLTTASQSNTNRSSGFIQFGNTTTAGLTSTIAFGGMVKGSAVMTTRMFLDSSGNLLVGKTSDDITIAGCQLNATGAVLGTRASGTPMSLNRTGTDGDIADFRKNGTIVGSIGTSGGNLYIEKASNSGLQFGSSGQIIPRNSGAPSDNAVDLGAASYRFDDIYATNGTIQTSDVNEKQDIEALSEAETRVAVAAKGLLRKFRWKSAVRTKSHDARIHFGIIAQDLQAAFEAEGLDAGDYGMFTSTTWTDEETGEERSRMGVRYSELLAFIIAAI